MSEQLKRCPFCGDQPEHDFEFVGKNEKTVYFVICKTCGVSSGRWSVRGDAGESWNIRISDKAPDDNGN